MHWSKKGLAAAGFCPGVTDYVLEHVAARDVPMLWTLEYAGRRLPTTRLYWIADKALRAWVSNQARPWSRLWGGHSGPVALRVDPDARRSFLARQSPALPGFRVVELS